MCVDRSSTRHLFLIFLTNTETVQSPIEDNHVYVLKIHSRDVFFSQTYFCVTFNTSSISSHSSLKKN